MVSAFETSNKDTTQLKRQQQSGWHYWSRRPPTNSIHRAVNTAIQIPFFTLYFDEASFFQEEKESENPQATCSK
jgi:hypothetical protein